MKNKRGISALVATVLLVLITIAAVGLIWGAILPIVQKGLGQSRACSLETRLIIDKSEGWTCFDAKASDVLVMIERPMTDFELSGIVVQISGGGQKVTATIRDGRWEGSVNNVSMKNETGWTQILELPGKGEARTYNISVNFNATQVGVAPIVKQGPSEVTCSIVTEDLPPCS